jgi:ABC-2 type transport system ATP-binding protein
VQCLDLRVRYGDRVAVDGLALEVCPGEVVAILGPNGAGKTTTVETLEGYRAPSSGSVRVLGLDPIADHAKLVERIGVMLQRGGIYPTMTPGQVVKLFSRYYEDPLDPEGLIGLLGLEGVARTPWRRLSGGEQQRVSLALALVGRPDVAFLDEPTAGVDPEGRIVIRRVVSQLRDRGAAVLLTTHELTEAERIADRIVILSSGRAIASGTVEELGALAGGQRIVFDATVGIDHRALEVALQVQAGSVTEPEPGSYRIDAEGSPARVAALTSWLAAHDFVVRNLSTGGAGLEEIYLSVVSAAATTGESAGAAYDAHATDGGRAGVVPATTSHDPGTEQGSEGGSPRGSGQATERGSGQGSPERVVPDSDSTR